MIGLLHEDYKRHRDMTGLAAAFHAKIGSLLHLADRLKFEEGYRDIRNTMVQLKKDGKLWTGLQQPLMFPTTIYEKCGDRVGMLGSDATYVVTYYNFLNGMRLSISCIPSFRDSKCCAEFASG